MLDINTSIETKNLINNYINTILRDPSTKLDNENRSLMEGLLADISTISSIYVEKHLLDIVVTQELIDTCTYLDKYFEKLTGEDTYIRLWLRNALNFQGKDKKIVLLFLPFHYYKIRYKQEDQEFRMFSLVNFLSGRNGIGEFIAFYYFLFEMEEGDRVHALARIFVHELTHLLLHTQFPSIWRFVDEGIAQFFERLSYIQGVYSHSVYFMISRYRNEIFRLVTNKATSFENLFISNKLKESVGGIDELRSYMKKIADNENVFADVDILKNSINLTEIIADYKLTQMFVNYVLSKLMVALLVVDFGIDINELKFISNIDELIDFLTKKNINIQEIGKIMYRIYAEQLNLNSEELKLKLYEYYELDRI